MVIRVKNIFSVRFVRFVRFLPRKGHSIFFQILRDFEPCDPSLSPSDLRKPSPRPFSRCPTFGHLARRLFRAVRPSDTPSCALPTFSDLRTLLRGQSPAPSGRRTLYIIYIYARARAFRRARGSLECAVACGAALLGFVASCYGHGVWGLLPHRAVTLPLPPDQSVPTDGIVPSKNLCHLFKERYRLPHAGYRTRAGSVQFVGSIVKTIFNSPIPTS